MLVNQETKVKTELVGVNIYLDLEEARILQYILRSYHADYICNKVKSNFLNMEKANVFSVALCAEITNKIMEG